MDIKVSTGIRDNFITVYFHTGLPVRRYVSKDNEVWLQQIESFKISKIRFFYFKNLNLKISKTEHPLLL